MLSIDEPPVLDELPEHDTDSAILTDAGPFRVVLGLMAAD